MARTTRTRRQGRRSKIQITFHRPELYEAQEAAIFNEAPIACVEASTKSGKTVGCIAWLVEQALLRGGPGKEFWWVAPIYTQAEIAYRRMLRYIPREIYKPKENPLQLRLGNGATIWFKSGDNPDNLYGEDVHAVVVDEASRVKEASWHAVTSTTAHTAGPIRAIGNVKGRGNWFYKLCAKARSGEHGMSYAKITALDAIAAGVLQQEDIDRARMLIPEQVFNELYMCIPSDDGGNPFGIKNIEAQIAPLSFQPTTVWGWDLAKSYDWTVGVGLDAWGYTGSFERFQRPWQETIKTIHERTHGLPALVDSTGVGDPVLEALQRPFTKAFSFERDPESYEEAAPLGDGKKILVDFQAEVRRQNFQGFKFNSRSKQQLMEGLAVAIQQSEVWYPAGPIVDELEAFEYEYYHGGVRYSAPEGMHDDCVCALALAVCMHKHQPKPVMTW